MPYKKLALSLLIFVACLILLISGLNYIIDPLQQYRKASFYKPFYAIGYQRYLNPGVAKTFDYDSIIISTSIADPFSPIYMQRQLKWNTIKLSIDSSNAYEQYLTLLTAIKTGKVKNVLYPIHYRSFGIKKPYVTQFDFPHYLYNAKLTFSDQIKYLLNFDIIITIIPRIFLANALGIMRARLNPDTAYMGSEIILKKNPNRVLNIEPDNYNHITDNSDIWSNFTKDLTTRYNSNFDELLLPILLNNKSINFYLLFPPFHLDYYCDSNNSKDLQSILNFEHHIYNTVSHLPNVKLYDFQSELSIVEQHQYYAPDHFHYDRSVTFQLIDMIKAGKHRLSDNYQEYSSRFVKEIQNHCSKLAVNSSKLNTKNTSEQ